MIRRPPRSTLTDTLFPYTTLFRSFDSRYPTSLNAGDARLLADGFTYSGTINTQGRFTPDAISRRRIDSLAARMAVIMSGSFGGCDDYCFLETLKNLLYRNLGILQLRSEERGVGKECVRTL